MDAEAISSANLTKRTRPREWPAALAGLAALLVGVGFSHFGYPPLIPALVGAGWFTTAQADYLGATNLAGYLLGAALVRRLTGRISEPTLTRTAMLIATVSFAACAFPLGFAWYFARRLVSGVIGGVLMVCAAPAILAVTPPERRGRVGGAVFTGVGLGIALSGTLVPGLVEFGLPRTCWCFAAISAVLTALACTGLPRPAARHGAQTRKRAGGARLTPAVLLLLIAYACNAIGFVPHTVFWVDFISRGLGQGLAVGSAYWVAMDLAAAAGPLLLGLMADRVGFATSLRLSLFAKAFGVALPLISTQP